MSIQPTENKFDEELFKFLESHDDELQNRQKNIAESQQRMFNMMMNMQETLNRLAANQGNPLPKDRGKRDLEEKRIQEVTTKLEKSEQHSGQGAQTKVRASKAPKEDMFKTTFGLEVLFGKEEKSEHYEEVFKEGFGFEILFRFEHPELDKNPHQIHNALATQAPTQLIPTHNPLLPRQEFLKTTQDQPKISHISAAFPKHDQLLPQANPLEFPKSAHPLFGNFGHQDIPQEFPNLSQATYGNLSLEHDLEIIQDLESPISADFRIRPAPICFVPIHEESFEKQAPLLGNLIPPFRSLIAPTFGNISASTLVPKCPKLRRKCNWSQDPRQRPPDWNYLQSATSQSPITILQFGIIHTIIAGQWNIWFYFKAPSPKHIYNDQSTHQRHPHGSIVRRVIKEDQAATQLVGKLAKTITQDSMRFIHSQRGVKHNSHPRQIINGLHGKQLIGNNERSSFKKRIKLLEQIMLEKGMSTYKCKEQAMEVWLDQKSTSESTSPTKENKSERDTRISAPNIHRLVFTCDFCFVTNLSILGVQFKRKGLRFSKPYNVQVDRRVVKFDGKEDLEDKVFLKGRGIDMKLTYGPTRPKGPTHRPLHQIWSEAPQALLGTPERILGLSESFRPMAKDLPRPAEKEGIGTQVSKSLPRTIEGTQPEIVTVGRCKTTSKGPDHQRTFGGPSKRPWPNDLAICKDQLTDPAKDPGRGPAEDLAKDPAKDPAEDLAQKRPSLPKGHAPGFPKRTQPEFPTMCKALFPNPKLGNLDQGLEIHKGLSFLSPKQGNLGPHAYLQGFLSSPPIINEDLQDLETKPTSINDPSFPSSTRIPKSLMFPTSNSFLILMFSIHINRAP